MYVHHSTWWTPPLSPLFHVWLQKLHGFIILHHKIPSFHMNSQFFPIAIRWCPRFFSVFSGFSPVFQRFPEMGLPPVFIHFPREKTIGETMVSPSPAARRLFGFTSSAVVSAAWRPKTTRSSRELAPRRLAPCTEAQPAWRNFMGIFHGIFHGEYPWIVSNFRSHGIWRLKWMEPMEPMEPKGPFYGLIIRESPQISRFFGCFYGYKKGISHSAITIHH